MTAVIASTNHPFEFTPAKGFGMSALRRTAFSGLVMTLGLLMVSCAEDNPDADAGGGTTGEGAVDSGDCLAEAEAAVEAGRTPIGPDVPAEPVDVSQNEGKTIWYISATMQLETMIGFADGVRAGAEASGLELEIFDGANSPAKYNEGITQAVAQGADGIILQGIDPSLVTQTLSEAEAAGIPTVDAMNGDPDDALQNGISSHITVDFTEAGTLIADYILAETECDANVLELTSSLYVALQNKSKGFNDEMERLCPSCAIDTQEVNFADFANSVSSVVRTAVQRTPAMNYVNAADDGIAFYTVPVLESLSSDLPVAAGNGAPANMALLRDGKNQALDIVFPPLPYMGWVEVDRLHRAMAGQDVPSGAIAQQIVDDENIEATEAEQLPEFENYEEKFLEAWGIG